MDFIRVSQGTAAVLGLLKMKVEVKPTTAYLMLYHDKKCISNCLFCPQANKSSSDLRLLSRVLWPKFEIQNIIEKFKSLSPKESFKRVCIQTINYTNMYEDIKFFIKSLKNATNAPISISSHPLSNEQLQELKDLGLERIGLPVDAATEDLFDVIKGKAAKCPYKWETHWASIESAVKIFGDFKVSTHLIIGLGENDEEAIKFIQNAFNKKVTTGLFTFTPIKGTALADKTQPVHEKYRRIQLARYLILHEKSSYSKMKFNDANQVVDYGITGEELVKIINTGTPFKTTGCPSCNRPFYNERPGKELYNYPRDLTSDEILKVKSSINK